MLEFIMQLVIFAKLLLILSIYFGVAALVCLLGVYLNSRFSKDM